MRTRVPSLGLVLRLVVAIGLTGATLWFADPSAVGRALVEADPAFTAAALLMLAGDRCLMAWRWMMLLPAGPGGVRLPALTTVRIFLVSTFLGTFLPASVGSDVLRAYSLASHLPRSTALASVVVDRVLGILSVFVMGTVGLLLAQDRVGSPTVFATAVAGAVGGTLLVAGGLGFTIYHRQAPVWILRPVRWMPWPALQAGVTRLTAAVQAYASSPRALATALAASIAVQVLRILQAYFLGRAIAMSVPLGVYFMVLPIIILIMLLPVTIGSLGTSQVAFVWFFGLFGVSSAAAFTLSVLYVALGVAGNLPGALLYATGGFRRPGPTQPREM